MENIDILEPFRLFCRGLGVTDMFDRLGMPIRSEHDLAVAVALQAQVKTDILTRMEQMESFDLDLMRSVYDALAQTDELRPADAIFVFGAPSNARIDMAVEIYDAGYAPKIAISGCGPNWQEGVDGTEAERMADRARQLGVPDEAFIIEKVAPTIPDNAKRTIDLFEATDFQPKSLIIVSSAFVMLRSYIEWMKYTPWDIRLIRIAPPLIDQNKGPELWHTNIDGRNVVINEYAKIFGEACVDEYLASKSNVERLL